MNVLSESVIISVDSNDAKLLPFRSMNDANLGDNDAIQQQSSTLIVATTTTPSSYGAPAQIANFGFRESFSIGDRIWLDANGDGIQNVGEQGIAGVVVQVLSNDNNAVIGSETSDDAGLYVFDAFTHGLISGVSYKLRIDLSQLPTLQPSKPMATTADNDSNGVFQASSNSVDAVVVAPSHGDTLQSIDFGFQTQFRVGGRVWHDINGDGLQQSNESQASFANIVVSLRLASNNTLISTTTTNVDGVYAFTSRQQSTLLETKSQSYRITIQNNAVPNYQLTNSNVGTNKEIDSNAIASMNQFQIDFETPVSIVVFV
jgi:hypothetical protein